MSAMIALASNPTVPRRVVQGKRQIEHIPIPIKHLLSKDDFNTYNLCPDYQRDIEWSTEAMNGLIESVIKQRYIPPILMYKLQPEDKTGMYTADTAYQLEIMDGQHRLWTLNAFRSAQVQKLPTIKKEFIVYWDYVDETAESPEHQCVFYEKTDDVERWCKETGKKAHFLSKEEKQDFDNTAINIAKISSRLTIEERRQEFLSLQKGRRVCGSDITKNMTNCPIIEFFEKNKYQVIMKTIFIERCSKKARKYWVNWAVRCFNLFKKSNGDLPDKVSEIFLEDDSSIEKKIKFNTLMSTEDELSAFNVKFANFISFLQRMDKEHLLNPTQIFALFYHLCGERRDLEVLKSHMPLFSKEGQKRPVKSLWKSAGTTTPRREYFNKCVSQLEAMVETAQPIDEKPITKKLKAEVWKKCANKTCECCQKEITKTSFEAGHIIARAKGGPTEIDNLVAICGDCNKRMATRNLYEFKEDVYPTKTTSA